MRPFCEPPTVTSTPQSSCRYGIEPSEEMVSTISRAWCPARSISARISGTRLATPVDVSLWTTRTALTTAPVSAASRRPIASGSAPCRQSPGITSGRSPSRPASWAHSAAKCPVSAISTVSPGDKVLTRAASQAPVPDEGKMTTGSSVPKTCRSPGMMSRYRAANSGPRWSITGAAMARSTRSGTLVGPGIWRKWRPACISELYEHDPGQASPGQASRRPAPGICYSTNSLVDSVISGRRMNDRVSARHDLGCRHLPAAGPAGPPGPATRHPRAGRPAADGPAGGRQAGDQPEHGAQGLPGSRTGGPRAPRPGQGTFVVGTLPRSDPAVQERFLASMTAWLRKARAAGLGADDVEAIYRTAVRNSFAQGAA